MSVHRPMQQSPATGSEKYAAEPGPCGVFSFVRYFCCMLRAQPICSQPS